MYVLIVVSQFLSLVLPAFVPASLPLSWSSCPFFISHSLSSLDLNKPSFCVIIEIADWHTIHSHPSKNKTTILPIYPPRHKWKISSLFLVPVTSVKWSWLRYLPAWSTVQSIMLVFFKGGGIKRSGLQSETV